MPEITWKYGREENYKKVNRFVLPEANKARAGKRKDSVDSLDWDMGTKQGMLNSNKKECQKEHLNFPPSTQLTYSIDLTDRVTKKRNTILLRTLNSIVLTSLLTK